jgi:sodium pump decarboxylase gamma subunit
MSPIIIQSIQVSMLSMAVIFLVLGVLIGVIKTLVHFLPYTAPPPPPPRAQAPAAASSSSQDEDHIAAIHAALAHHLGKAPHEIQISNIQTL